MSLYQHIFVFYAVMAAVAFFTTRSLPHDEKRVHFLSAFLVGATWPMSFPATLLFPLFQILLIGLTTPHRLISFEQIDKFHKWLRKEYVASE